MTEKRTHVTVTMRSELYEAVKAAANEVDQPLTAWCREAVLERLKRKQRNDPTLTPGAYEDAAVASFQGVAAVSRGVR